MDYAFVPGITPYHKLAKKMIELRDNTKKIDLPDVKNVNQFLKHLENVPEVSKPVGDLWILTHANDAGVLHAYLDSTTKQEVDYEEVVAVANSGSVAIPAVLRQNEDGTPADVNLHIRGCRVGKAKIFLQKMKEAFDGVHSISAPNFTHIIVKLGGVGYIEHLSHDFQINSKDKIKDKTALIEKFKGSSDITFFEGTRVPDNLWKSWIPNDFRNDRPKFQACLGGENCPEGKKIGDLKSYTIKREYKHGRGVYPYFIDTNGIEPTNKEKTFKDTLETDEPFKPTYPNPQNPYPIYQRLGYKSIDDFIDGFEWKLEWKFSKKYKMKGLECTGIRHEYHVYIPIVDLTREINKPEDLEKCPLFFNFYHGKGVEISQIETLKEDDKRLFTVV